MDSSDIEIPILSLDDDVSVDVLNKLREASLQHGFFYLKNEKSDGKFHIPMDTINRIWNVAKEIFDVSEEEKRKVHISHSKNHRGYFSSLDYAEDNRDPDGMHIKDNKEGFFFGSDSLIDTGNVVPAGKEALIEEVERYMMLCKQVCTIILCAVAKTGLIENINVERFVDDYLSDPVYMLKLLKYPPKNGNTDAHADYGLITLLLPGDSGLEIHSRGTWHSVPVVPNAFVINLGDLLAMWTNNNIKSTIHRVQYNSPEGKYRYSVPFFMHPSRNTLIKCKGSENEINSYDYLLSKFDKTYAHRKS